MATIKVTVEGDFSDLQIGDRVTTPSILEENEDGTASTQPIPGIVVDVSSAGAVVATPHMGKFGVFSNRAAITLVERGGKDSLRAALIEAARHV